MGALSLSVIKSIIGRGLLGLGVSFLMLAGFSELLAYARTAIETELTGLGADAANFLGLCGADFLINSFLAGHAALLAMSVTKKFTMR
jgi:hypothetical protein